MIMASLAKSHKRLCLPTLKIASQSMQLSEQSRCFFSSQPTPEEL